MKKLSLFLALVLFLCLFTSCAPTASEPQEAKPQTKEVKLTEQNYDEYLIFNMVFDDFSVMDNPDCNPNSNLSSYLTGKYILSCNTIITTEAKKDNISFKNIKVTYEIGTGFKIDNRHYFSEGTGRIEIGPTGYSKSSVWLKGEGSTISFPSTDVAHIKVTSISGTVIITE